MPRGQRVLNNLIFEETNKSLRRGRSEEFIRNRNECLLYRYYYYYSKINRLRYEDVLEVLSNEFFLASRTITDLLGDNSELVKTIFRINIL